MMKIPAFGTIQSTRRCGISILGAVLLALAPGCETTGENHRQAAAPRPAPKAAMIIFLREFSLEPGIDDISSEHFLVDCIRDAIKGRTPDRRFVAFDDFRKLAFPGLPAKSAPRHPRYIRLVIDRPDIRNRIARLKLRYMIFVGGVVETRTQGGIGCLGAGPGVGCFGLVTWDKKSRLAASVLDLEMMDGLEKIETTASGTAWLAVFIIFPFGLPSAPEGSACNEQGERIAELLIRRDSESGG